MNLESILVALALVLGGGAIGAVLSWARFRIALARKAAVTREAAERHAETSRQLAQGAARLSEAMDGSRLAMWELDMRTGQVNLSANWWALMGGVPRESPIPIDELIDRVPDGEQADCWTAVRAVLRGSATFYDVEHRVRRDDGTLVWIRSRGAVSAWSGDGRVLRMTGTNFDITARKTAQLALAESEATLRRVAGSLGVRVLVVDAGLRVLFDSGPSGRLDGTLEDLVRWRLDELRTGITVSGRYGKGNDDVLLIPLVEAGELARITVVVQPAASASTPSRNGVTIGDSNTFGATNQ